MYFVGGHYQQIHHHLCELLAGTETGEMLSRVSEQDEENCCDLYQCYLRDYIRSVHRVMHKQSSVEYKVRFCMKMIFYSYIFLQHFFT